MSEISLKARVNKDHKLTAKVPESVPIGVVEITIRVPESHAELAAKRAALVELLERWASQPGRVTRTKEDIDRQIDDERSSWD